MLQEGFIIDSNVISYQDLRRGQDQRGNPNFSEKHKPKNTFCALNILYPDSLFFNLYYF